MKNKYCLAWLDTFIGDTLNVFHEKCVTNADTQLCLRLLEQQTKKIKEFLRQKILHLPNRHKIKWLSRHYYHYLIALLNELSSKRNYTHPTNANALSIYNELEKNINELLQYLQSRFALYLNEKNIIKKSMPAPPTNKADRDMGQEINAKILCYLSSDQLAILLRAIDEERIVKVPSLRYLFRSIVPYLSTPNRHELSFDAMRSKSYTAELRDKKITIDVLQRLIERIKEY